MNSRHDTPGKSGSQRPAEDGKTTRREGAGTTATGRAGLVALFAPLGHAGNALVDLFMPEQDIQPDMEELRRARLGILMSFLITFVAFVFLCVNLRNGNVPAAVTLAACGLINGFGPFLVRRQGAARGLNHLTAAVTLTCLFTLTWFGGGINAAPIVFVPCIGMGMTLLNGSKPGLVWSGISIAALLGVHVAHGRGWVPAPSMSPEKLRTMKLLDPAAMVLCTYAIASFFQNTKDRLFALVGERTRLLQKEKAEAELQHSEALRAQGEAEQARSEVKRVLDNVGQGFLTLTRDGRMERERSAIVQQWLGDPEPSQTMWEYTHPHDATFSDWMELAWDQMTSLGWDPDLALAQLPKQLTAGERVLGVKYIPLMSAPHHLERMVMVLTDITVELEHSRADQEQRELVSLFQRISRDRLGLEQLMEESRRYVSSLSSDPARSGEAKRLIHTLKGNCMAYGIESVAQVCEVVEQRIADEAGQVKDEDLKLIHEAWRSVEQRLDSLLNITGGKGVVQITREDLHSALRGLDQSDPQNPGLQQVHGWLLEPCIARLSHLGEVATHTARKLGKPSPLVHMEHHGLRLCPERWSPIWTTLVHVIRNAVSHGIEAPDRRELAHKPPAGQIWMRLRPGEEHIELELEDDGAGIDWDAVASKAQQQGLPHETPEELERALFSDGLSTAQHGYDEISGRGVGLGAVRHACERMGGSLKIISSPGAGTCFRFVVPIANPSEVWQPPAEQPATSLRA